MTRRLAGLALLLAAVSPPPPADAQERPYIPEDLQRTCGAFAAAMVAGDAAEAAAEFYAEDAVVLVDSEHVYRGRSAILEGFLRSCLEDPSGPEEDGPETEIEVDRVVAGEGAVTLAGRYSSPAGAAGVYSNTWKRQADGSWRLAASVMTFEPAQAATARSGEGFSCTRVLGFSQSMEWYGGLSLADHLGEDGNPDPPALDADAFLPGWQGRFVMGAAVEQWTDPGFPGWSGAHRRVHETPAHCARDEVDRVVFNVSGAARSPEAWAAAVDSVAELIRSKFPAVERIVVQPVVGAPEGACTDVRAARNHPVIVEGIRRTAEKDGITAGPRPKVASCGQFSDALGHLTVEGAERVRRALREHYRASTAGVGGEGR
jgi:ketosteroid isomerase-like protein